MGNPTSRSRKWWLILGAALIGLVIVAFGVVTSAPFLRTVVLPQVGAALQSDLKVGDIRLNPFSSLTLRDIRVTPTGSETLLTAVELRVRYRLGDILRGKIVIDEATLDNPVVTVVTAPDGTSNLSRMASGDRGRRTPAKPSGDKSVNLDVRNVSLKNGTVRWTGPPSPGMRTLEVTGLNGTLDSLTANAPSRFKLGSGYQLTEGGTNSISGTASGEFQFQINERLLLRELNGAFTLTPKAASGGWREFGRLGIELTADSTGSEIRQLRLGVTDGGQPAGEIRLNGPFDPDKKEARIAYEVKGIGRSALGLAGALAGVDFGATRMEADGRLMIERGGGIVAWQGRFSADPLTLGTTVGTTPVLGLSAEFRVRVDRDDRTAMIEKADLSLRQGKTAVVLGSLDRPMSITWDSAAKGSRDATYILAVRQLELASWQSLLGPDLPSGRVDLETRLSTDRDGHLLRCQVTGGITDLSVKSGSNAVSGLRLDVAIAGSLEDFKTLLLEKLTCQLQQGGQRLAQSTGLAQVNLSSRDFSGQFSADLALPALMKALPIEGVRLTSGTSTVALQVGSQNGQTNGALGITVSGLSGDLHGVALRNYEAKVEIGANLSRNKVQLQRGTTSFRAGSEAPGTVDLTGEFELSSKRGEFRFKGANLNETSLAPLVAAVLSPRRLESVSVEFSGSTRLDLEGHSTLNSSIQVGRLVVRDPSAGGVPSPMSLGVTLDASGKGRSFDLTRLAVTLEPTDRARNELLAAGHLEVATNDWVSGTLSLTSAGLDLTGLANLMSGSSTHSKPAPVAPSNPPGVPIHLPIGRFVMDSKLDAVFLREVAVSNWVARVEIQQDRIVVNPFSLSINGAPVSASADFNVGVPGWVYDVKGSLSSVPISPLAKSFLTGDRMDLAGSLSATMDLKGAGVEGAALRQHLIGNAGFSGTNLNYRITALQTPLMQGLVRTLSASLQIPGISESPIRAMEARLTAGQGLVNLASARVSSDAFMASSRGEIRLADVLTNSAINLPVTVSLPRSGTWDELPTFLTFKGTLGAPRPDIDALALARTLTRLPGAAGDLSSRGVEKLGSALDRALGGKGGTNAGAGSSLIKGLLGGQAPATNAPGATNAAKATNTPAVPFNPLDLLKKKPAQP